MRRLFFRFFGVWFLAGALFAGVVDGAKSIAASAVTVTPVAGALAIVLDGSGPAATSPQPPLAAPWPLDILLAWLVAAPAAAVLAALGLLFLMAGRRPRPHMLSREYAT